jgi:5'-nucleotidase
MKNIKNLNKTHDKLQTYLSLCSEKNIIQPMKNRPLILVTNDDGIHSPGIEALISVVEPYGDIFVVAPEKSNSAKSHAVTLEEPLYVKPLESNGSIKKYACSGTPVDCVKIALSELMEKKPDYLVSGINHGSNSAINIIYSGTMAAAFEGCINGIPSVGFSLAEYGWDLDFTATKKYADIIFQHMMEKSLPAGICLNVNVPYQKEEIKGIRICRQTKGAWNEEFEKRNHPHGRTYYWLTGDYLNHEPGSVDTDDWALRNNYVAVVPVNVDFTDYPSLDTLKDWNYERETKK